MNTKTKFEKTWFAALVALAVIFIVFSVIAFYIFIKESLATFENWGEFCVFLLFSLVPLLLIGFFATKKFKNQEDSKKKLLIVWLMLFVCFACIAAFSNFWSNDYVKFLKEWCDEYSSLPISEAFAKTTSISNYTPVYNYFLIVIAHLGINSCLWIKYISFVFTILLAFVVEKIVCHLAKGEFNFVRFVLLLFVPPIFIEFTAWGQCDAIYISLCLLSLLFGLKHKSKLSFMFLGLAFAFKLQFLFIVPLMFLLLVLKDENGEHFLKWKDIWIVPVMYAVNLLPVVFGAKIDDVLLVYFRQSVFDDRLSGNCPNVCFIFQLIGYDDITYKILACTQFFVSIAVCVVLLVFSLKYAKKKNFVMDKTEMLFVGFVFAFVMVFFMPKMLDRFFMMAMFLSWIYFLVKRDRLSFTLCFLLTLSVFFSMWPTMTCIWWIQDYCVVFGLLINIVVLFLTVRAVLAKQKEQKK